MKKTIFYISSLIITIVVALSARATAFSSETKESGPGSENIRISSLEKEKEANFSELENSFKSETKQEQKTEAPSETKTQTTAIIVETTNEKPVEKKQSPAESIPVFRVTDYISECTNVNCFTSKDAERGVVQFKETFYYGHSSIAFNRLKTVYVGQKIQVVDKDGKTRTYQIRERMVKEKAYLNGAGKEDGFTAGIYAAKYNSKNYSASFMTCGNGTNDDSNYRLILFADEI